MRSGTGGKGLRSRWLQLRRFALAVVVLAAAIFLFPDQTEVSHFEGFHEGGIAPETIVAPFEFDVPKSDAQLAAERKRALEDVPAYFQRSEPVKARVLARFDDYRARADAIATESRSDTLTALIHLGEAGVDLPDRSRRALLDDERRAEVMRVARSFIDDVLRAGYADEVAAQKVRTSMRHMLWSEGRYSLVNLRGEIYNDSRIARDAQALARLEFRDDDLAGAAFRALVTAFLEPNLVYDRVTTERAEATEIASVSPVARRVLPNENIVEGGHRITPDVVQMLGALQAELESRRGMDARWKSGIAVAGRVLLSAAILVFCIVYIRLHRPRVYADTGKLMLLAITALVVFGSAAVVLNAIQLPWLLIPVAAGSMVVSLLIDAQLGVFFTLVSVVMLALNAGLGLDFVAGSLVGGFTGVYAVQRVRHRSEVFRALLLVSMAYVFTVSALAMMRGDLGLDMVTDSGWALVNAALSTVIAITLMPILEVVCGVTTDLRLLELSDLNRPLLKRLMLEAPGTYHHSMVMGTLVEAGCEQVGANSLLGRVMCYYHDIGKVQKPEYFIENIAMNPRARNPHDRLTPSMSCLILESHVREGVQLAKEHKLPEVLIDAIREHHGTSEMAFFYQKAKAADPNVDRDDFRYPGPRPRSKETATVMLADGVEAASRVLTDPKPSRIRGLVTRIIESRVEAGELEECGLTLADLARIREAFVLVLTGMFHGRVRYPTDSDGGTSPPEVETLDRDAISPDAALANAEPVDVRSGSDVDTLAARPPRTSDLEVVGGDGDGADARRSATRTRGAARGRLGR